MTWRGDERVIASPDLPPGPLDRLPLLGAMRWMDGPFVETWRSRSIRAYVAALSSRPTQVAVQEGVVDNWISLPASLAAAAAE
jgi:hypothetical protein